MKHEIKVPPMGESINEATVAEIIKPSGSAVGVDEEIIELETDKVNQVLHAPSAGVLTLTVKVGDVVKIGAVLGSVEAGKEAAAALPKPEPVAASIAAPAAAARIPAPSAGSSFKPRAAEGSQRISKEQFVSEISASKPVAKASVPPPKAVEAVVHPSGERGERRVKMSKIRKVIARRLVEAQQSTAMLTTFNEADMSEIIAVRERHKESFQKQHGVKLGFMSFFVKACVTALKAIPGINAFIEGEELIYHDYYDIGIAIGTEKGLVVPVLRGCEGLSFPQIESGIAAYAVKAREGGLTVDDLQGGTFTITNGGVYGSLLSTPILNMPQSGILGMHKIQERPVVVKGKIEIRPMMYLALSYDHRVVDGKEAVAFLVHVKNELEDPSRLLLELN